MKIQEVIVEKIDFGTTRPYTIAFKTVDKVENVVVKLVLENGVVGYGSANPSEQVVGESLEQCYVSLQDKAADLLVGKDIRNFSQNLNLVQGELSGTTGPRTALDTALHDAFTTYLGVPLVSFLGEWHKELPTSITIGIKTVEETLAEAEEYIGRGFSYLKIKLGLNVEEDIERLKKLREKFGEDVYIRVDANQGYSDAELYRFYQATRSLEIELIEQPLISSDIEGLRKLQPALKKMIAADESLRTPEDALTLVHRPEACGIFNIKLMKTGGILPARQIAQIADWHGIDLMWGCNDESIISISAALHAAFSCPNTFYLDLDGSLDLARDIVSGGFIIDEGYMRISGGPGLGLSTR
jgi:L-Ala-D/L-Glu epimerase